MRVPISKNTYGDRMARLLKNSRSPNSLMGAQRCVMLDRERWFQLCQQAVIEEDPTRLFELVQEINHLLEERREGLRRLRSSTPAGP
jgi:hypothetical protein